MPDLPPTLATPLRGVSLAALEAVDATILDAAVACLFPETVTAPVPVAAFQSAI